MARGQLKLFDVKTEHGGDYSLGKRKSRRPFCSKRSIHLTLRASAARGAWSMLLPKHVRWIESLIAKLADKWGVRVYEFSNNGNHLHFLLRAKSRVGFQNFLRVLSAQIAIRVTGARKASPSKTKFWDKLAFTRLVEWGRAFKKAKAYVFQNYLEAIGAIPYTERATKVLRPPSPVTRFQRKWTRAFSESCRETF